MAIQDTQKLDFVWKKIGFAATKTDTNSNKLAANEAIPSPLLIRGDKVWQQAGDIPATKPSSSSGVVTVYTGSTTVETTNDNTATANRTWKTGFTDWIPPEFGSTYLVNVYLHDSSDASNAEDINNKLFITGSGNDDEWFFDYQSGVLHFIGDNLPSGSFSGKSIYVAGARYTGTFGVGSSAGEDAELGNLTISNTTISTANTNDDIILSPQGTGIVDFDSTLALQLPAGTQAERPGSPAEGYLRYNTSTDTVEVYTSSGWVKVGDPDTSVVNVDTFTGDGSTTAFTLSGSATTNQLLVEVNGVSQAPTTAYSASGTTLTFTEAVADNDSIVVRRFTATTSMSQIADDDSDTKIQVEESDDEDVIRFDVAGNEVANMTSASTIFSTAIQVANFTTTERDALSAANGMIIYNTTDNKFQGYENGAWANLI